jgi:hypothetical protein
MLSSYSLHPPTQTSSQTSTQKQFYAEIPEDQQRLLDLKYFVTVRIESDIDNGCKWNAEIVNQNQQTKKIVISNTITLDNEISINRNYLQLCLHLLDHIYKLHTTEEQSYINVEISCPNVYVVNVIREWLSKWATNPAELVKKPNGDLLVTLLQYQHLEAKWIL